MAGQRHGAPDSSSASNSFRRIAGGLVVIIAATILGFKIGKPDAAQDLPAVPVRIEATSLPTLLPVESSKIGQAPTGPEEQPTATDPFPESPAAQIEWAVRHGKPSLILFHSTTCKPCKIMEDLVQKVRGDYESRIIFVGVVVTNRANADLIRQARIQTIPTTFFVDATGQGRGVMGAMAEDKLRADLDRLAGGGR